MYESDPVLYSRLYCHEAGFDLLFLLYDHQDQRQDLMGSLMGFKVSFGLANFYVT